MPSDPRQLVISALAQAAMNLAPVRSAVSDALLSGITAPHDALYGTLPMYGPDGHTSTQAIDRAADLAGLIVGTPGTPSGAAGAGAAIEGLTPKAFYTRIPDEAPASLRDRYWYELYNAANGKDVNRIKLTPERIQSAVDMIAQRSADGREAIPDPYTFKQHGRQALDFAKEAVAQGNKVSVKYPDGPMGSVYVRVGDKGTVRFADHPAPIDSSGQTIGGYSKTLGRRHGPASLSVAPYDGSYEDALRWLAQGNL